MKSSETEVFISYFNENRNLFWQTKVIWNWNYAIDFSAFFKTFIQYPHYWLVSSYLECFRQEKRRQSKKKKLVHTKYEQMQLNGNLLIDHELKCWSTFGNQINKSIKHLYLDSFFWILLASFQNENKWNNQVFLFKPVVFYLIFFLFVIIFLWFHVFFFHRIEYVISRLAAIYEIR